MELRELSVVAHNMLLWFFLLRVFNYIVLITFARFGDVGELTIFEVGALCLFIAGLEVLGEQLSKRDALVVEQDRVYYVLDLLDVGLVVVLLLLLAQLACKPLTAGEVSELLNVVWIRAVFDRS